MSEKRKVYLKKVPSKNKFSVCHSINDKLCCFAIVGGCTRLKYGIARCPGVRIEVPAPEVKESAIVDYLSTNYTPGKKLETEESALDRARRLWTKAYKKCERGESVPAADLVEIWNSIEQTVSERDNKINELWKLMETIKEGYEKMLVVKDILISERDKEISELTKQLNNLRRWDGKEWIK